MIAAVNAVGDTEQSEKYGICSALGGSFLDRGCVRSVNMLDRLLIACVIAVCIFLVSAPSIHAAFNSSCNSGLITSYPLQPDEAAVRFNFTQPLPALSSLRVWIASHGCHNCANNSRYNEFVIIDPADYKPTYHSGSLSVISAYCRFSSDFPVTLSIFDANSSMVPTSQHLPLPPLSVDISPFEHAYYTVILAYASSTQAAIELAVEDDGDWAYIPLLVSLPILLCLAALIYTLYTPLVQSYFDYAYQYLNGTLPHKEDEDEDEDAYTAFKNEDEKEDSDIDSRLVNRGDKQPNPAGDLSETLAPRSNGRGLQKSGKDLDEKKEEMEEEKKNGHGSSLSTATDPYPVKDLSLAAVSSPTTPAPQLSTASSRLFSLDTFRGFALSIMIFVNAGGGGYSLLNHSPWNGIHFADLVFPWFIWIMLYHTYTS